jgi:hypothetical protein
MDVGMEMDADHPPIAYLPNLGSSPPIRTTTKKRKQPLEDEFDIDFDTAKMPPTFFASSSSSVNPVAGKESEEPPTTNKTTTKKKKEKEKTVKEPKPKKVKMDDKPKATKKKGSGVEVVIEPLASAEKVKYKSKEFIDDTDDEGEGVGGGGDPLLLVKKDGMDVDASGPVHTSGDEATGINAVIYVERPSKGKKKQKKAAKESNGDMVRDDEGRNDRSGDKKGKGKGRVHRVVHSEGEDEELDNIEKSSVSPVRTAKEKGKGKEKQKQTVNGKGKAKKPTKSAVSEEAEVVPPPEEDETLLEERKDASKVSKYFTGNTLNIQSYPSPGEPVSRPTSQGHNFHTQAPSPLSYHHLKIHSNVRTHPSCLLPLSKPHQLPTTYPNVLFPLPKIVSLASLQNCSSASKQTYASSAFTAASEEGEDKEGDYDGGEVGGGVE